MYKVLLILCLWQEVPQHENVQAHQIQNSVRYQQGIVEPANSSSDNADAGDSKGGQPTSEQEKPYPKWTLYVTAAYTLVSLGALIAIFNQNRSIQNTERAVLVPIWENFIHVNPETSPNLSHCFTWNFTNWGKTPAFVEATFADMMVINSFDDLPRRPKYSKPVLFQGDPIPPQKSLDFQLYAPMRDTREYEVIQADYRTGGKILFVFGYVKYRDMYGRKHETKFGLKYRAAPELKMYYDGFFVDGPKSYNSYK
jgi:hypothetical protein